ncbi:MAG: hypothetical protein LBB58_03325 [Cellulomonadaceae bacterium]|jgi:hypothetical protein|nr:hypothetical protein [Cellulomonadaceae bacterium]
MSIEVITLVAWGGVALASLGQTYSARRPHNALVVSGLNLGLAVAALTLAFYLLAPAAILGAVVWLFIGLRTYPHPIEAVPNQSENEPIHPLLVSSAAADSWSSVAGQGGSMGFGSMTRLAA